MFQLYQEEVRWMGAAVNPSDDTDNVYVEAFPDPSGTGAALHGSYIAGETNFLVLEPSGMVPTWFNLKARGDVPQTNQYVIEWDWGQGTIAFGTPVTHTYGGLYWDCGLIHVWDVPLIAGSTTGASPAIISAINRPLIGPSVRPRWA